MLNKRGISTIVATVLIVLVAVVAVTVLWAAILPLLDVKVNTYDSQVSIETAQGFTFFDKEMEVATVQVGVTGEDQPDKIQVLFEMSDGSVLNYYMDAPLLNSKTKKIFELKPFVDVGVFPIGVSVVPVFGDVGSEELGMKVSLKKIPEREEAITYYGFNTREELESILEDPNSGCSVGDSRECSTDLLGVCSAGTQNCSDGVYGSCTSLYSPSVEVCDGLDNDCDGEVDEGVCETSYVSPSGAVCDSIYGAGYECDKTIDDSLTGGSFWVSVSDPLLPQNVTFDLGEIKFVDGVEIFSTPFPMYYPQNFSIYVSDDYVNWNTVIDFWEWQHSYSWTEISFDETSGRYIRISYDGLTVSNTYSFVMLVEFKAKVRDYS